MVCYTYKHFNTIIKTNWRRREILRELAFIDKKKEAEDKKDDEKGKMLLASSKKSIKYRPSNTYAYRIGFDARAEALNGF